MCQRSLPPHALASTPAGAEWLALAEKEQLLPAEYLPGSGSWLAERRLPDGRVVVDWTCIVATSLGGNLSVDIVNNATAGALHTMATSVHEHVKAACRRAGRG